MVAAAVIVALGTLGWAIKERTGQPASTSPASPGANGGASSARSKPAASGGGVLDKLFGQRSGKAMTLLEVVSQDKQLRGQVVTFRASWHGTTGFTRKDGKSVFQAILKDHKVANAVIFNIQDSVYEQKKDLINNLADYAQVRLTVRVEPDDEDTTVTGTVLDIDAK